MLWGRNAGAWRVLVVLVWLLVVVWSMVPGGVALSWLVEPLCGLQAESGCGGGGRHFRWTSHVAFGRSSCGVRGGGPRRRRQGSAGDGAGVRLCAARVAALRVVLVDVASLQVGQQVELWCLIANSRARLGAAESPCRRECSLRRRVPVVACAGSVVCWG